MMQITTLVAFFFIFQFGVLVKGQSATVECGDDGADINITISGLATQGLTEWNALPDQDQWDLNDNPDADCQVTLDPVNGEASYSSVTASNCATVSDTADYFQYVFAITPVMPGSGPVRAYDHDYEIACRYFRNGTVEASFQPIHEQSANADETNTLELSLTLYTDASHTTELTGTIDLESIIYARVGVTDVFGVGLDLFLAHCWASKDSGGRDGQYNLIVDSCGNQQDSTVSHTCAGQTDETEDFNYKAFRYPGQANSEVVYLQCDVYVCRSDDALSWCQTQCDDVGCTARRKRRDADQFSADELRHVRAGPYTVVDGDEGHQDAGAGEQEGKPASTANLAIILSVSGVVAIAIVCVVVVVVLRNRRQNVTLAEAHDNNMKI